MVLSRDNGTLVYTQKRKKSITGERLASKDEKDEINNQGKKIPRCKSHTQNPPHTQGLDHANKEERTF